MVAGPGIETSHIIPKSMYFYHPDPDLSDEDKWNAVNSNFNCMAMDSICHKIHDNCLLAIHHVRFIQALFLVAADFRRLQIVFGCLHLHQPLSSRITKKLSSRHSCQDMHR